MKTKCLVLTSFVPLLTYATGASAQHPPEVRRGLWKAQWVTSPGKSQRDSAVLHFRKIFEISQVPEHFVVHVSADNQFLLCVNQHEVGRGPALSELAHWKYETYDLAAFLHPGRNELAATVWNFGALSPLAQISDRTAFVLEGNAETERFVDTDNSWEVEEDKGVKPLPTPSDVRRFYYAAVPSESIDGASFDWFWNDADSSRGKWEKATSIGNAIDTGAALQN